LEELIILIALHRGQILQEEYEQVFKYREFVFKQTSFLHGGSREKKSKLIKYLYILKDSIFEGFLK